MSQTNMLRNFWSWGKLINLIIFLSIFQSSHCQLEVTKNLTFNNEFHDFQIDHYGFSYLIKDDNLFKRNINGEELYSYSNKLLGDISQLDITNPLRPLLLYKDQGVIVVLDNTLSQQKEIISLNEIGLYQAKCIANSNFDNGIWLYDIDVNEIIKIDGHSKITYNSGNLSVIINEMNSPVFSLFEKNKKLYALTKNTIFILDQFGSLIKTIKVSCSNGFIVDESNIICYDGQYIKIVNSLDFKVDTLRKTSEYSKIAGHSNQILGLSKNMKEVFVMKLVQ